MNKSLKVLFFLRTRTSYVSGLASIYMRVTVEGDRFEMATQREVDFRMRKYLLRNVLQKTPGEMTKKGARNSMAKAFKI